MHGKTRPTRWNIEVSVLPSARKNTDLPEVSECTFQVSPFIFGANDLNSSNLFLETTTDETRVVFLRTQRQFGKFLFQQVGTKKFILRKIDQRKEIPVRKQQRTQAQATFHRLKDKRMTVVLPIKDMDGTVSRTQSLLQVYIIIT